MRLPPCCRTVAILPWLCGCAAPVPGDPAAPPAQVLPDLSDWWVAGDEDGLLLAWRPVTGELRRNQDLELSVRLYRNGVPQPGARIVLRGWMPEHGHGFVQQPRVLEEGGGAYLVTGVRLHMRGAWRLTFEVIGSSRTEAVPFDVEI